MPKPLLLFLCTAGFVVGCASVRPAAPRSASGNARATPQWQETIKANAVALGCSVDGEDANRVVLRPCNVLNNGAPVSSAITAQPFREPAADHGEHSVRLDVVAREEAGGVVVVEIVDCVLSDDVYVRQCPGTDGIHQLQSEALAALSHGFAPFGS
jgi:hypothetical protein